MVLSEYAPYAPIISVCVLAGVARTLIQERRRSFNVFVSALFLSAFVGVLCFHLALSFHLDSDLRLVSCGASAFLADDVLYALRAVGLYLRRNPIALLKVFITKLIK